MQNRGFWVLAAFCAVVVSGTITAIDVTTPEPQAALTVIERTDPPADVKSDRLPTHEWAQPTPSWEEKMKVVYKNYWI